MLFPTERGCYYFEFQCRKDNSIYTSFMKIRFDDINKGIFRAACTRFFPFKDTFNYCTKKIIKDDFSIIYNNPEFLGIFYHPNINQIYLEIYKVSSINLDISSNINLVFTGFLPTTKYWVINRVRFYDDSIFLHGNSPVLFIPYEQYEYEYEKMRDFFTEMR